MNPLDSLLTQGKITAQQHRAGQAFAEAAHKYLESIGAPAISGTAHGGGRSDALPSQARCKSCKDVYLADIAKLDAVGVRARMSTMNIAMYDQHPVDDWDLESLKIGLNALL